MNKYCCKCNCYETIFAIDKNRNKYCRECLIKLLKEINILDLRKLKLVIDRRVGE